MAVDIQKVFAEDLPVLLKRHASSCREIGATYQINISGSGGGAWFLDLSDAGPSLVASQHTADCEITLDVFDFQKLYENPYEMGLPLFLCGKLRVAGNRFLAVKLQKIFELVEVEQAL